MKKKNLFFSLFFFSLVSVGCCNKVHKSISFQNNSDIAIYIIPSGLYPDTISFVNEGRGYNKEPDIYKVEPQTTNSSALWSRSGFEEEFQGSHRYNILMVYVFDAEIMENVDWKEIGKNHMVLQRYDLSLDDLQELDWKLIYPPNEAMRYVKMYPPYEKQ